MITPEIGKLYRSKSLDVTGRATATAVAPDTPEMGESRPAHPQGLALIGLRGKPMTQLALAERHFDPKLHPAQGHPSRWYLDEDLEESTETPEQIGKIRE